MTFTSRFRSLRATFFTILSFVLLAGTFGCSMGSLQQSGSDAPAPAKGPVLQGSVFGGQQPITGATLQLYAAGAPASGGGYGTGAVALIPTLNGTTTGYFPGGASGCVPTANGVTPVVTCTTLPTSDSQGNFTISNDYSCPSATSQVYLVATGGNPQVGGSTNPYISLMAALGPCSSTNGTGNPSLNVNSFISINEVTTVGSVYALNQFMSAPAANVVEAIGAPGTTYNGVQSGIVGMVNAFSMVNNITDIAHGNAVSTNPNFFFVEGPLINTLADILAYCINSDPNNSTSPSPNCSTLMADATPAGKAVATDTLQAAYYMVHNPYNNVANLYLLVPPTPPFAAASSQPSDFTLQVQVEPSYYSVGFGQTEPAIGEGLSIAIDQYGNAWVLNKGYSVGSYVVSPSVTEIGQNGAVLFQPTTSFNASTTGGGYSLITTTPSTNIRTYTATGGVIAIDTLNNAWVTNKGDTGTTPTSGSVGIFPGSTGVNVVNTGTATGYYTGTTPDGIAIDGSNNVFIAAVGNAASAGTLAGKSINEFVGGSGTFTYSANVANGGKTTAPYALLGGNTKLAIDQNTAVTNNLNSVSPVANDGPVLWTSDQTDCTVSSIAYGTIHQYTTKDLLPTANSAISGTSTCAATAAVATVLPAAVGQATTAATGDPTGIAIDKNNNVWIANTYASASSGFDGMTFIKTNAATDSIDPTYGSTTYAPTAIGAKGTATTGVEQPYGVVVDGNNIAWVGNLGINSVAQFSATVGNATTAPTIGSPVVPKGTGHQASGPQALAIDPSGNVWLVNAGNIAESSTLPLAGTTRGNTLNILVGAAGPVVTPLSVAIGNKVLGQKP